jgi:hypothetical protein
MNFDTVSSMLSLLEKAKGKLNYTSVCIAQPSCAPGALLVENENGSSTPKDDLPAPSAGWMIGRSPS